MFLQDEIQRTLMAGLTLFQGRYVTNQPLLLAVATLSILPVAVFYLLTQRTFVRGSDVRDGQVTALPEHPTVLMFGEVNPDIVVTAVPDLTFGQREDLTGRTTMTVGSSVAITACGLARLGTPTGLVGVIGDDAFGDFMLQRLRERQVLVDRVRTVAGGRTGSSVILVRREDNNDRHILTDRGVMGELRAA